MLHYKKFRLKSLRQLTIIGGLSMATAACSLAVPTVSEESEPTESMLGLTLEDEIHSFHSHQRISDYTDRLAHDLVRNMRERKLNQPMMITSFVNLDDSLKKTSKLGNLISENLIGNMQAYDIQVMDIHLMGTVDITPTGDYVFSRDGYDISSGDKAAYVLSGVVVESERGFAINARIMELKSKKIISTASTFIPFFVVEII